MKTRGMVNSISHFNNRKFYYCDVGARGGISEPWKNFRDIINIIGFEPDTEEYKNLLKNKEPQDLFFPYALSKTPGKLLLNLTKNRGCSSFYKPNLLELQIYPEVERFSIDKQVEVEATSLDDCFSEKRITDMDFIKIDSQGAELDILHGGRQFISENILGIEVEVEFVPIYENQPLFNEVNDFITRQLRMQIQDIKNYYWKYPEGRYIGGSKGKLIFGDALYFKPANEIVSWCSANMNRNDAATKLQMACIMGVVYGYLDYSLHVLNQPLVAKILGEERLNEWVKLINRYGIALYYQGKGGWRLEKTFKLLSSMFQSTYHGWASIDHELGSRKKFGIFG